MPIKESTFGPDVIWVAHACDVRVKGLEGFLNIAACWVCTHVKQTGMSYLCVRRTHMHSLGYL